MGANAHVRPGSLVNVFDPTQLKPTAEGAVDWRQPVPGAPDYVEGGTLGIVLAIERIGSSKEGHAFFLLAGGKLGWVVNYDVIEEARGE